MPLVDSATSLTPPRPALRPGWARCRERQLGDVQRVGELRVGKCFQIRCSWNGTIRVTSPPTYCHMSSMVRTHRSTLPKTRPMGVNRPSPWAPVKFS